jgi:hypothetical protein
MLIDQSGNIHTLTGDDFYASRRRIESYQSHPSQTFYCAVASILRSALPAVRR